MVVSVSSPTISPVSGSNCVTRWMVSPHHSIRVPICSYGGKTSSVSPVHAERAARAADLVALVLDVDEPLHRELERDLGSFIGTQDLPLVLLGRAQPVDARDARHDEHVAARQQGGGGGVPEALDLVVHRRVLLDVRVGLRDVGLGLVVVVVADEVLDRVVGEDLAELVGQLGAQRLVGRDHQGRALDRLDHVRDRERLAGAGGTQQREVRLPGLDALGELRDRLRLVAGGLEVGGDTERGHGAIVGPPADTHGTWGVRGRSAPGRAAPADLCRRR